MIKILLAEDHNVVRNGIRSLLEKEGDMEVVAEAANGSIVLQLLKNGIAPNVIITAMNMQQVNGIALIESVKAKYPDIKIMVLSSMDDEKSIVSAFKAGATGYMLKSINAYELVYGIKHVYHSNERFLCNDIAVKLLEKLISSADNNFTVHVDHIDLSVKEIEVLSLIAQGFTNQEISNKLFSSKRTIESYRKGLIEKTGSRNTAALISYAVLNSIIK